MSLSVRVGKVGIDVGPHVIYCGRPGKGVAGPFGNPFIVGRDGTRDEVIAKHAAWFHAPEQVELRNELYREAVSRLDAGASQVVLTCFCHPKSCHCDTMVRWLDKTIFEP
jgi:hypothetical protein